MCSWSAKPLAMSASSRRGSTSQPKLLKIISRNGKRCFHLFSFREAANTVHHKVVESFCNHISKLGLQATIKTESELEAEHVQDQDIIISLGIHT
jgi:hypothetical protein